MQVKFMVSEKAHEAMFWIKYKQMQRNVSWTLPSVIN